MAVKDHSLDSKIVESAKKEFLEFGFNKASINRIAKNAGITTGALYTRYKNKDDLFISLISKLSEYGKDKSENIAEQYYQVLKTKDFNQLLEVIKSEEKMYMELLFKYYDECILFFCKSHGSSVETHLKEILNNKNIQTIKFLKQMGINKKDLEGIDLIILGQFEYYRLILEKGYSKEKAIHCMENVENFLEAGWKNLFDKAK